MYKGSKYVWKAAAKILLFLASMSAICLVLAMGKSEALRNHVSQDGYLVNDMGQSYGPDVKESSKEPDLILVESDDGTLGYVKREDLSGPNYKTPEEALLHQTHGRYIVVYLSDGKTKVGKFYIGN